MAPVTVHGGQSGSDSGSTGSGDRRDFDSTLGIWATAARILELAVAATISQGLGAAVAMAQPAALKAEAAAD